MSIVPGSSWEDLRFPATGVNPPGAVSDPDWDTTNGGWLFDAGGTEILHFLVQLPHGWAEGSTLRPHVHWEKTTSASGNVYWRLEYQWLKYLTPRSPMQTINKTAPIASVDTADTMMITTFGDLDATGYEISDMLFMKLSRIGGDATDTYGADARLLEFDVHHQLNAAGSAEEFVKGD